MWGEKATHMAAPVTSPFNGTTARSVDSTVTYRKQQGVPRESLRYCEKNAGHEAHRLTNASACSSRRDRFTSPAGGNTNTRDNSQRVGGNVGYRQRAVS
jgi:hypothetical protein